MTGNYQIVQIHEEDYSCTCIDYCRDPKECLHLSLVKLFMDSGGNAPWKPNCVMTRRILELESNVLKGRKKKVYLVKGDTFRWTFVWVNKVTIYIFFGVCVCVCFFFVDFGFAL